MFSQRDQKLEPSHGERLTATFFNSLAAGLCIVGGIAPVFGTIYGSDQTAASIIRLATISIICFIGSGLIHLIARAFLEKGLRRRVRH